MKVEVRAGAGVLAARGAELVRADLEAARVGGAIVVALAVCKADIAQADIVL